MSILFWKWKEDKAMNFVCFGNPKLTVVFGGDKVNLACEICYVNFLIWSSCAKRWPKIKEGLKLWFSIHIAEDQLFTNSIYLYSFPALPAYPVCGVHTGERVSYSDTLGSSPNHSQTLFIYNKVWSSSIFDTLSRPRHFSWFCFMNPQSIYKA